MGPKSLFLGKFEKFRELNKWAPTGTFIQFLQLREDDTKELRDFKRQLDAFAKGLMPNPSTLHPAP